MKDNKKKEFIRICRKNKVIKKVSEIFIILAIFFISLSIIIYKREFPKAIMPEDIDSINQYVECNIYEITECFADTSIGENISDEYYFALGESSIYILNLSKEQYNDIVLKINNKEDNNEIKVYGMSQEMTPELKGIVIDSINGLSSLNDITSENIDSIVTPYVINAKEDPNSDFASFFIDGLILGIIGIIFVICKVLIYIRIRCKIEKFDKKYGCENILSQIPDSQTKEYYKTKTILTKDYIINYSTTLAVIKYTDILWLYTFYYKFLNKKYLSKIVIVTKDKEIYMIAGTFLTKKGVKEFKDTKEEIIKHNPNILIGYTKENIEALRKENIDNTIKNINKKNLE